MIVKCRLQIADSQEALAVVASELLESTSVIASGDVWRRFVIGSAAVVVKHLADRIVVNSENGIGIILITL